MSIPTCEKQFVHISLLKGTFLGKSQLSSRIDLVKQLTSFPIKYKYYKIDYGFRDYSISDPKSYFNYFTKIPLTTTHENVVDSILRKLDVKQSENYSETKLTINVLLDKKGHCYEASVIYMNEKLNTTELLGLSKWLQIQKFKVRKFPRNFPKFLFSQEVYPQIKLAKNIIESHRNSE